MALIDCLLIKMRVDGNACFDWLTWFMVSCQTCVLMAQTITTRGELNAEASLFCL